MLPKRGAAKLVSEGVIPHNVKTSTQFAGWGAPAAWMPRLHGERAAGTARQGRGRVGMIEDLKLMLVGLPVGLFAGWGLYILF